MAPAEVPDEFPGEAGSIEEPAEATTSQTDFDDRQFRSKRRAAAEDDNWAMFFPPTDPVLMGAKILGGFSRTSMESMEVEASTLDGRVGDEALVDAILRGLREDAATAALDIKVEVEDRVAYLRGLVPGIEDAENAEEVAGRLPDLDDVVEELEIQST